MVYIGNDDPVSLLHALAVLASVLAAGWVVATFIFRLAPRAAWQFAAANILFLASTLLESRRGEANPYLAYQGADLIELAAFTLMRGGVQSLERLGYTCREHLAVLALSAIALLSIPPDFASIIWMVVGYAIACAWILGRLFGEAYASLRGYAGPWSRLGILWPGPVFAAIQLARAAWLLADPGYGRIASDVTVQTGTNVLLALIACLLLLAWNISLIGLVIARLVAKTRELARRDALTGAWNRRALDEKLAVERARLRRGGPGFAVAMIDLDRFKSINDTLGHAVGDAALRHAADTIARHLRATDTLARYGGEEFTVIFPMADAGGALSVCERVRAALERTPFPPAGRAVTASIGLVECVDPDEPIERLLKRADDCVYAAKENGRNRIETGGGVGVPTASAPDIRPLERPTAFR